MLATPRPPPHRPGRDPVDAGDLSAANDPELVAGRGASLGIVERDAENAATHADFEVRGCGSRRLGPSSVPDLEEAD